MMGVMGMGSTRAILQFSTYTEHEFGLPSKISCEKINSKYGMIGYEIIIIEFWFNKNFKSHIQQKWDKSLISKICKITFS